MTTTTETNDTTTSGITRQRERAIQYWNDSKAKHNVAMKDHVHDDVITRLLTESKIRQSVQKAF
jgi:hypothetical protein